MDDIKSENSLLMHYLYAVADIGHGPEVLKLHVEEMYNPGNQDSGMRAYSLQNIEKAFVAHGGVQGKSPSSRSNATNAICTVADLFAAVKRMDPDFQPNPVSGIVNKDGTPRVMYHGSPAQFTIFDKKKARSSGQYGRGFYFTNSESHAGTYGNLYSVYLNIRNPLEYGRSTVTRSQVRSFLEAVAENEDYSIENYGTYDVDTVLQTIMGKNKSMDAFRLIQDVNATAIGDMVEASELFNQINGTKFDGIVAPTETVAFYPEQIKSATDNIGTFGGKNPDIRYKVPVGEKYWYPNMTKAEIAEVKSIAQNEANKTDNYLGIDSKWLYNNQKGHKYFAMYSTAREEITLLYACKDNRADFEYDLLKDIIEEDGLNESVDTGSATIDKILSRVTNASSRQTTNRSGTVGAASNAGNVAVHSGYQGKRPSKAFLNCLRNISEVQSRYGVDDNPPKEDYRHKLPVGGSVTAEQVQAAKEKVAGYRDALGESKADTRIMEQEFMRIVRVFERDARRSGQKDVQIADLKVETNMKRSA